jgi:hypothetical protein
MSVPALEGERAMPNGTRVHWKNALTVHQRRQLHERGRLVHVRNADDI